VEKFRDIITYLIYDKNWKWLETVINTLCTWEMNLRWMAGRKVWDGYGKIPEGLYCYANKEICPYWAFSRVATFFYGTQCSGYCYLMGEGDFNSDTFILWDQCKCCGINDEINYDGEGVECNLEL